nr:hypothetical protein [Tanacetum cinerariifolium]
CKLLAVGSPFFWQWEHPPLVVRTYTASGNPLLAVGMPCAFYSQQDYDSGRDILIRKDLPSNNSLSFAKKESFHFDISSFSRPPAKPPDGDTGILNIKMMGDIYDQKSFMHKLMITLAPYQKKSLDLLSHRCGTVKKFNTHRSHLNKCPMLIHGQNNPLLDVLLFHFYPP